MHIVILTFGQKILITTQDPWKRSPQDQPPWHEEWSGTFTFGKRELIDANFFLTQSFLVTGTMASAVESVKIWRHRLFFARPMLWLHNFFLGIFVSNFGYWFFAVYIVILTSGQKILITTQDPQNRSLQDQPPWPRGVKWHFHHRKKRAHRCKFVFWLKAFWSQERWCMQLKVWKPGGAGPIFPNLSCDRAIPFLGRFFPNFLYIETSANTVAALQREWASLVQLLKKTTDKNASYPYGTMNFHSHFGNLFPNSQQLYKIAL